MREDIATLSGGPSRTGAMPLTARGRVVVPPASVGHPMRVVLTNFSADWDFEIPADHWNPRGLELPVEGNRCLVAFDDDGDAWVPVYEGGNTDFATQAELVAAISAVQVEVASERPLYAEVAAEITGHTSTSYADLVGSPGPSLTIPATDDWLITIGFVGASGTGGTAVSMSYEVDAPPVGSPTAASDNDRAYFENPAAGSQRLPASAPSRKALVEGTVLTAKYKVSGASGLFGRRWMRAERV